MTAVINRLSGLHSALKGYAAVGVAKANVFGGGLKGLTDGVVVRDGDGWRLPPFDQKDGETRGSS
jgi:hypothetical protein